MGRSPRARPLNPDSLACPTLPAGNGQRRPACHAVSPGAAAQHTAYVCNLAALAWHNTFGARQRKSGFEAWPGRCLRDPRSPWPGFPPEERAEGARLAPCTNTRMWGGEKRHGRKRLVTILIHRSTSHGLPSKRQHTWGNPSGMRQENGVDRAWLGKGRWSVCRHPGAGAPLAKSKPILSPNSRRSQT